jgi:hypothetical protein
MHTKFWYGHFNTKYQLGNLAIGMRVILKCILDKYSELIQAGSEYDLMMDFCDD